MSGVLTRRELLRRASVLLASGALPIPLASCASPPVVPGPSGEFFDEHDWAAIDALMATILPSGDDGPGAHEAVAVRYADRLLSAFDVMPPRIYASGPSSGRQPFPDATTGAPTTNFPPDAFETFLPLSRVKEISWRIRLFGSAETTGGDFNDAVLGPTVGLRTRYRDALTALDTAAMTMFGARFGQLTAVQQRPIGAMVLSSHAPFAAALLDHTIEGTFAAPEYGGNEGLVGWQLARWDGDSMPLGHSFYDEATHAYVDRADQPTSTATPGDTDEPYETAVANLLRIAALGSGGMVF